MASYQELTGNSSVIQLEMKNPGMKPAIKSRDSAAGIALKPSEFIADNDAYHTQEGLKAGLKDLVIDRMPKVTI